MIGLVFLALLVAAASTAFFTGAICAQVAGVTLVDDVVSVAVVGLKALK